jgi:ribosome biogenesis GTPase
MTEPTLLATVSRLDAKGCLVRLDEPLEGLLDDGHTLWCNVRGRIHLRDRKRQKAPLAVGDRVHVIRTAPDRGAVESLEPRRSMLSRPDIHQARSEHVMAANVDQVVIVSSAEEPPFNPGMVDRVLAVVAFSNLEPVLVVNKRDLVEEEPVELPVYRELGVPVIVTSATEQTGIDRLRAQLVGKVSVVMGHSGVGKSSLLNAVQPKLGLAVGEVNAISERGTHTTTASIYIPLEAGGAVIDTAGVREFGLFGIPERDLGWLLPDIAAFAAECRYGDCSHTHEPECAVQAALVEGQLAAFRFDSYLKILESLSERK